MSGRAKEGVMKHRKIYRDNIHGITKPAIKRLARRGGVKTFSGSVVADIKGLIWSRMNEVLTQAYIVTKSRGAKTINVDDVTYGISVDGGNMSF